MKRSLVLMLGLAAVLAGQAAAKGPHEWPLTHTRPGQAVFPTEGMTTHGGWFRSPFSLRGTLVSLGLPAKAPSVKQSGLGAGAWAGIAAGALALAGAGMLLVRRRKSGESPA